MRNYGTGLTPVVAVRQQNDHRSLAPSNISPYRPPRLPLDILHLIFNFCSVFDLLTCRLVCRSFDHFITNDKQLVYKTSLIYERQVNCALSSLPAHDKLRRLRRQGAAWRGEAPSSFKTLIPVTRSDSIYELNCGLFALGDVLFDSSTKLDFLRLPSVLAERREPEWTQVDSGITIVDFTMDLDLDLLVLIEHSPPLPSAAASPYRVHLRSMTTNKPHPLTSNPILEYPCHKQWWEYQLVVSIFGDHLGLLFCSGRPGTCGYDRLAIWNWRTGDLLAAMHAKEEVFDSFLFLSEGVILLPSIGTASLKIITYPCTLTSAPLHPNPNSSPQTPLKIPAYPPQAIASFSLPALQAGLGYVYILARSQPTAARAPSHESGIPFAPDIHEGIIVLSVRVGFTNAQQEGVVIDQDSTIILRRSTIWNYAFQARGCGWGAGVATSGNGRVMDVPWALWSLSTRWFRDMPSPRWVRDVHGTRFAARVLTPDGPKTRIYDFNTLPYRRHSNYPHHSHSLGTSTEYAHDGYGSGWSIIREEDKKQWVRRPVWEETLIKPGTTFAEEVVTGLAYLEITSVDSVEYSGLMIDGERIVGMQTDESGNLTALDLLIM